MCKWIIPRLLSERAEKILPLPIRYAMGIAVGIVVLIKTSIIDGWRRR